MKFFKTIFFILIIISFFHSAYALEEDFNYYLSQGKNFYLQKDYDKAIEMFEKIVSSNVVSGNVYYNLGNCYFKKQDIGKAMLYYQRAKRLIPQDKDLIKNMELINTVYIKENIQDEKWWIFIAIGYVSDLFALRIWLIIGCVLYVLLGLFVFFMLNPVSSKKNLFKKLSYNICVGLCFVVFFIGCKYYTDYYIKYVIVIDEKSKVKSGPSQEFDDLFELNAGTKVKLSGLEGEWSKVRLSNGMEGWVETNRIERI